MPRWIRDLSLLFIKLSKRTADRKWLLMHPECPYYSLHPLFTVIHRHPCYAEKSKMAAVDSKIHPYEDTRYIENSDDRVCSLQH